MHIQLVVLWNSETMTDKIIGTFFYTHEVEVCRQFGVTKNFY